MYACFIFEHPWASLTHRVDLALLLTTSLSSNIEYKLTFLYSTLVTLRQTSSIDIIKNNYVPI